MTARRGRGGAGQSGSGTGRTPGGSSGAAVKILMVCLCLAFLGAAGVLAGLLLGYQKGEAEYEELLGKQTRKLFLPVTGRAGGEIQGAAGETDLVGDGAGNYIEAVSKDSIEELAKINPDVAAWIEIPAVGLSYPVVQGKDNEYYLEHTFRNRKNTVGALFIESSQRGDFREPNTIIYGHHMKDGSMFGSLTRFRDRSYFEKDASVYVTTRGGVCRYTIFACYSVRYDSAAYTLFSGFGPEFSAYLEAAGAASLYPPGSPPDPDSPILTLSTCDGGRKDQRFIVQASLSGELKEQTP